MIFVDETKKAIDIILLKDKNPKAMGVGEAFGFYYKASLIPMILTIIVAAILGSVIGGVFGSIFGVLSTGILSGILSLGFSVVAIIFVIIMFWIITPISILITSLIYHLFGVLLKQYKQGYNATLSALVYAEMVTVLLFFLLGIPFLGIVIAIIVGIWGLVSVIVIYVILLVIFGALFLRIL